MAQTTLPPAQFSNFPNVEIDEFGSNVGPYSLRPRPMCRTSTKLIDNLSYIRGKHTFKFGVEGRNYIAPTNDLPRARGEWDYATLNAFINDLVPDGANGALRGAGNGCVADNYPASTGLFRTTGRSPLASLSISVSATNTPAFRATRHTSS